MWLTRFRICVQSAWTQNYENSPEWVTILTVLTPTYYSGNLVGNMADLKVLEGTVTVPALFPRVAETASGGSGGSTSPWCVGVRGACFLVSRRRFT